MYTSVLKVLADVATKPILAGDFMSPVIKAGGDMWLWMRDCGDNLTWERHKLHTSPVFSDLAFGSSGCNGDPRHPYQAVKGRCCLYQASDAYFIETEKGIGLSHPFFPRWALLWIEEEYDRQVKLNLSVSSVVNT